jgi:hypothetical protein
VAWCKAYNSPQSVEGVPAWMERCSGSERITRTPGAGSFYARAAAATPYRGGGALGQGTSIPAVSAASD